MCYRLWESLNDNLQVGLPTAINNTLVAERTGDISETGGTSNTYKSRTCVNMFTTNDVAIDPNIISTGSVCEGGIISLSVQQYSGGVVYLYLVWPRRFLLYIIVMC